MHPVLLEFWIIRIYSYGFMLALSFFAGIWLAGARAEKRGIKRETILDMSIILIIAAVVGSRGLYIITHRDHYNNILDIIALWQGGATYYGGLILALAGAVIFLRKAKIPFFRIADICAPSIALGVFLTRIGCFLSGCCFGKTTLCPVGMVFPPQSPAGHFFGDAHIHPTQLYSSLYGIVIFIVLILLDRKLSRREGATFALLCMLYGAARFTVDFFRYYEETDTMGLLTMSQILSLGLAAAGAVMLAVFLLLHGRRSKPEQDTDSPGD